MSERDEFEVWFRKEQSKDYFWDYVSAFAGWQGARASQAVPALTELVAWMHVMDNTEGIPENEPWMVITQSPENPFGVPGEDYSETFPVTSTPLYAAPQPSPEPKEPEHAHDWRFSLQDHVYKCDCGATRGDYPFGAASFKD